MRLAPLPKRRYMREPSPWLRVRMSAGLHGADLRRNRHQCSTQRPRLLRIEFNNGTCGGNCDNFDVRTISGNGRSWCYNLFKAAPEKRKGEGRRGGASAERAEHGAQQLHEARRRHVIRRSHDQEFLGKAHERLELPRRVHVECRRKR